LIGKQNYEIGTEESNF